VRGKISARARQNLRTCAAKSPHVRGKISARAQRRVVNFCLFQSSSVDFDRLKNIEIFHNVDRLQQPLTLSKPEKFEK
jgi:hypothetical protein